MLLLDNFMKAYADESEPLHAIHLNPWPHSRLDEMRDYLVKRFSCSEVIIVGEGDGVKKVFHAHGLLLGGTCGIDHRRRILRKHFKSLSEVGSKGGNHPLKLNKVVGELQIFYLFKGMCHSHQEHNQPCISWVKIKGRMLPNINLYKTYRVEYDRLKVLYKKKMNSSKLTGYSQHILNNKHLRYVYHWQGATSEEIVSFLIRGLLQYYKKNDINFRTSSSIDRYINFFLSEHEPALYTEIQSRVFMRRYFDLGI